MATHGASLEVRKVGEAVFEIPRQGSMRVPARVYATDVLMDQIRKDKSLDQVANVACMPGILRHSLAMPDIHWGYGFPIGGVAAFDEEADGVVSPGGVGYDINCGVRLLRTRLTRKDVEPKLRPLLNELYRAVPTGVGEGGVTLSAEGIREVSTKGARWALERGFGKAEDLRHIEENGCIAGADPAEVSERAFSRGRQQVGSLGSGNHFREVDVIDEIYHDEAARTLGLESGQVCVIIHTGSRGFGHQVATDHIHVMDRAMRRYGISLPDRQLCCAPIRSPEGRSYLGAMRCAVNFAFANRQVIAAKAREAFERALHASAEAIGMEVVYEVAHNIAKMEEHELAPGGPRKRVCVHRKGATRAFPPGNAQIPPEYRGIGQPVLIPGDMGRYSFVLVGAEGSMRETWGSTCHGAGRLMSRTQAKKLAPDHDIEKALEHERGVLVRGASRATVAEEWPDAYKDVAAVVDAVEIAGISRKVARLRPIAVIMG